jgi:cell division protein FtsI/penicillin-binding protein 2
MRPDSNISHKANRVLNVILLAFLMILIRVWYLGSVQHDEHVAKALKPQRKTIVDKVQRATIRDRFNIPLATNKIQYNAAVRYADLRQIPSGIWKKDITGKKFREPVRNNYIVSLSEFLGQALKMDPVQIEDTIHAKASLFPHTPFIIKEDLTEEEYFALKLKEKDWIGMEAQTASKRIYPLGKVGCDLIGYLGAINQNEYVRIAEEIKTLSDYIDRRDRGELALLPKGFNDPIEVRTRLKELQEKAYTINDRIGKTGIESVYEEVLRGLHGKKIFEADNKGNCLRELASSKKSSTGQRVLLSISSELQEYAESLLAYNETVRQTRDKNRMIGVARPWILGGAIVAMDPNNGEVLAMASYPRFNPNDFIPSGAPSQKKQKQSAVQQWLENETFVGEVWDGKRPLERECFSIQNNSFYTETEKLTWTKYLDTILPPSSKTRAAIDSIGTVGNAYRLITSIKHLQKLTDQEHVQGLIQALYCDSSYVPVKKMILQEQKDLLAAKILEHSEEIQLHKRYLDRYLSQIKYNDDKVLVLDLCRLALTGDPESPEIFSLWNDYPLTVMHELNQSLTILQTLLQEEMQKIHHTNDFAEWRKGHFKEYLKQKRKEEKEQKRYVQPYTDYLEKVEKALFKEFWSVCRPLFIDTYIYGAERINIEDHPQLKPYIERLLALRQSNREVEPHAAKLKMAFAGMDPLLAHKHIKALKGFSEMTSPLWGNYRFIRNTSGNKELKHLAGAFYPLSGFGYGRSYSYRQSTVQGSVFKLVIAYEALREKYHYLVENHMSLSQLNPLTLVDQLNFNQINTNQQILGYTQEGTPIRRFYKGGNLPRSHANIGTIDVKGALEQSSNMYFSYLASEHVEDPTYLEEASRNFGYGAKTGIDLPGEISGNIPSDLSNNKTGLYSFAIGQHSLVVTPLQTSVMLSTIANQGKVLKPKLVQLTAGKKAKEDPFASSYEGFPFQEQLSLIGIHFPLFTEAVIAKQEDEVHFMPTEVKREIFLPQEIRSFLLGGMQQVINGPKGTARPSIIRALWAHPKIMKDYNDLRYQLVGKTGTGETLYKQWIDAESKAEISNNIWFGGISFHHDEEGRTLWDKPEIAIAVFLRFSDTGGKEAAPLAAQMVAKWREICEKHGTSSHIKFQTGMGEPEAIEW